MNKIRFIGVLTTLLFLNWGCSNLLDVKNCRWIYIEGYHIGDLLDFRSQRGLRIDNDGKIFLKGEFVAKVVEYSKNTLRIAAPNGKNGTYAYFDR